MATWILEELPRADLHIAVASDRRGVPSTESEDRVDPILNSSSTKSSKTRGKISA